MTVRTIPPGVALALRSYWRHRARRLALVDQLDQLETQRNRIKSAIDDEADREQDARAWLLAAAAGTQIDGRVDELLAQGAVSLR